MKTTKEVYEYCNKQKGLFSFHLSAVAAFLPYDVIKESLKPETVESEWNEKSIPLTRENVIAEMKDYFSFAMEKADDQRGLSAARSMQKYQAWIFALGDEEFSDSLSNYSDYGKPQLEEIKARYFQ